MLVAISFAEAWRRWMNPPEADKIARRKGLGGEREGQPFFQRVPLALPDVKFELIGQAQGLPLHMRRVRFAVVVNMLF